MIENRRKIQKLQNQFPVLFVTGTATFAKLVYTFDP
jgi:hypothetical protein